MHLRKGLNRRAFLKMSPDDQVTQLLALRSRRTASRTAFLTELQDYVKELNYAVIVAFAELTFDYCLEGKEEFARWCIQHPHPSVRSYGCSNLQFWGDDQDVPALRQLVRDDSICEIFNEPVWEKAIFALCAIRWRQEEMGSTID